MQRMAGWLWRPEGYSAGWMYFWIFMPFHNFYDLTSGIGFSRMKIDGAPKPAGDMGKQRTFTSKSGAHTI